jgi:TolB-like protein/DNA-binding winged helix-turn-helix (wHTH) protein/Tfp pilus assembly protein PilF
MSLLIKHFYRFGEFTLDTDQRVLLRGGKPLPLTPKVFDTLLTLVENGGRIVEKDELMRRVWPDSFVEESNLTTNIKELRKALGDDARKPRYVETVARRGYRFIADVEEVLSEASAASSLTHKFETQTRDAAVAPKANVVSETAAAPEPPAARIVGAASSEAATPLTTPSEPVGSTTTARKASGLVSAPRAKDSAREGARVSKPAFAVAALAVALVAVGWWSWHRPASRAEPSAERPMLAVLPFKNLTGDASEDYLSDGLTEELIAQLGGLDPQRLGVIARTSVMHYKEGQQPLDQIGRELGVQYVLEGGVRREGDDVRVTAQFIRVRDQSQLWSREYDRQLRGLLALQRDIGGEVAEQIRLTLGGTQPAEYSRQSQLTAEQSEAYDLYLRGQFCWNRRTVEGFDQAIDYFQRALEKDPTYARAYVGLADSYALVGGYSGRPQPEFMRKAREAARRALELDPDSAEAHTALALVVQNYDWDWQTAEREFRRAIELNPNYATAHHWYAEHLMWRGRFDEALQESERARRLDPLSLIIAADRGAILYYARRYDAAVQQFLAVRELEPNFPRTGLLLFAYEQQGRYADAISELEERIHTEDSPYNLSSLVYDYGRTGQREKAQRALDTLLARSRRQEIDAVAVAWAYVGVGDNDQAFAWLEKAYAQHSNTLTGLKVEPRFDPLRDDPRFKDLLRRVGLDD